MHSCPAAGTRRPIITRLPHADASPGSARHECRDAPAHPRLHGAISGPTPHANLSNLQTATAAPAARSLRRLTRTCPSWRRASSPSGRLSRAWTWYLLCFCGFPEKGGQRFAAPCPTGAVRCGSRRGAHWCTCTAQPLCRGRRCGWVPCRDCRCSRAAPVGPLQPTLMRRLTAWHRPHRARPIPATTSAIQTARAICGTRTDFASAAQCAATAAPAAAVLSNLTKRRQRRWQPSSRSISLRSTLNLRARRDQSSKKPRLAGTAGTASCSIACHSQERRCAGCMKPGRGSAERGPFGPRSSSPRTRGPMQVRSTCCCAASPSCSHACVGEGVYVMQMLAHVCLSPPGRHVSSDFRYLSLPSHTYTGQDCPGIGKGKLYTADEVARDSSLPYPL